MPLLRVNATSADSSLLDPESVVQQGLSAQSGPNRPAVIMVHGYKYAPGSDHHCPHKKIFSTAAQSWPALLGLKDQEAGLGVALGWYARGPLKQAHKRAQALGAHVAAIARTLRSEQPNRPVHVIAHSLGAEAALSALPHLTARSVDRMVLLTGASHVGRAHALLDTPAGRTTEVLNVTSRENDLFDAAFERFIPSNSAGDRAIGQGILAPNVANLQLDCARTLQCLRQLGFDVAEPERRVCHWSGYKRRGVMELYKVFLNQPERLPLKYLQMQMPTDADPRWSRLLARPGCLENLDILLPRVLHPLGSGARAIRAALNREPKNEPAY